MQEISHKQHLQTGGACTMFWQVKTYSKVSFCYRRNYRVLRFKQCVHQRAMRTVAFQGLLKETQVMAPPLSGAREFAENGRLLVPMCNGREILEKKIRCSSWIGYRNLKYVHYLPKTHQRRILCAFSENLRLLMWSTSYHITWLRLFESKFTTKWWKYECSLRIAVHPQGIRKLDQGWAQQANFNSSF